jgi:hypothetical protein
MKPRTLSLSLVVPTAVVLAVAGYAGVAGASPASGSTASAVALSTTVSSSSAASHPPREEGTAVKKPVADILACVKGLARPESVPSRDVPHEDGPLPTTADVFGCLGVQPPVAAGSR